MERKFVLSRVDPFSFFFFFYRIVSSAWISNFPPKSRQFPIGQAFRSNVKTILIDSNYDNYHANWTHNTYAHTHTHLLKSICTCLVDDNLINHRSAIDNCTHFSQSPGLDEIKKKRQLARDLLSILEREIVFNWFRGKFNLQGLTEDWNSKIPSPSPPNELIEFVSGRD